MLSMWWDGLILNALALLLAVGLDRALPEPPGRIHPVVWMGRTIAVLERAASQRPAPAFIYGCIIVILVTGFSTALSWLAVIALASIHPVAYVTGSAIILRATFTVRGLSSAARQTRDALREGRLEPAQASLRNLVSRDPTTLTPPLVAASAIESVAENTTDSFVGPWLAFAVFGVPGAVAYRAVNTLDSMLGYRGRYEYLGKASARLDDALNLIPARLSALFLLLGGALGRLPMRRAWLIMLRDRQSTASPNAGWTMSAIAGLLGVRLEKPEHYVLGEGMREPNAEDISTAIRLAERTAILGVIVALGLLTIRHAILG
ncbi:MAG: cobalamin biosynthesis protein CobD [Dehalococcoidia bacterium]|nr:cobalamin biosynthesis protein CobD [Dehalococcoidia bacterium]